jgi:catechol-2,3-dioxygenase
VQIRQIELAARDLEAQAQFYGETLGLAVAQTDAGVIVTVQANDSNLSFHQAPDLWAVYHVAFNIPASSFAAAKQWLAQRVPLLAHQQGADEWVFPNWDARALYFFDADGNLIEFIARKELPAGHSEGFGFGDILCISEAGIVVDGIQATASQLCAGLGIAVYRNTLHDDFAAVGDAHGLLILSRIGRPWLSLIQTAETRSLAAQVDVAGKGRFVVTASPLQIRRRL